MRKQRCRAYMIFSTCPSRELSLGGCSPPLLRIELSTRSRFTMAPSKRPAWRPPPPPSPSRSLLGLEKAVPPAGYAPSSSRSLAVPDAQSTSAARGQQSGRALGHISTQYNKRGASSRALAVDKNKALPPQPRRSSSVYTVDAKQRYTEIIDSYQQDELPVPQIIHPTVYRQTISPLLDRRLDHPSSSLKSVPSAISGLPSPSTRSSFPDDVVVELPAGPTAAPSLRFASQARPNLDEAFVRASDGDSSDARASSSSIPYHEATPKFRAVSYESVRRSPSLNVSPKNSWILDSDLIPRPLSLYKSRGRSEETKPAISTGDSLDDKDKYGSHFSRSSSEDSYVIYTGIMDYVRHQLRQRREKSKGKGPLARLTHPFHSRGSDTEVSNDSTKPTGRRRMSSIYRSFSRMSVSGSFGQSKDPPSPQGRPKQRAIPTSPYQKYGAAVWTLDKKKAIKRSSAPPKSPQGRDSKSRPRSRPATTMPDTRQEATTATATASDSKHLRLGEIPAYKTGERKMARLREEHRKKALKESIKMIGPTDEVSDGVRTYRI